MADGEGVQEVLLHLHDRTASIEYRTAFKVVVQAPEIQIGGSHGGHGIVADEGLGVVEADGIFVDLHAASQQLPVVGAGGEMDDPLVPSVGRQDPHIHAALCCQTQSGDHAVVYNEIGGVDVEIVLCIVDDLQIDVLAHIVIVRGAVGVGLDEAVVDAGGRDGAEPDDVLVLLRHQLPHLQKDQGKAPGGIAPEHNGTVPPVAVFLHGVDILVRQIDAAGEGHLSVDDGDLPVIPVVLFDRQEGLEGIEYSGLNAIFFEGSGVIGRQGQKAAHVIIKDTHQNALGGLALQDFQNAVPHDALLQNEGFYENVMLRPLQLRQQRLQHPLAGGKVVRLRLPIDREFGVVLKIADQGGMCRELLCCLFPAVHPQPEMRCELPLHRLDRAAHPPGGTLEIEQQIHDPAKQRKHQHQHDPGGLEGTLVPPGDNVDGDGEAGQRVDGTDDGRIPAQVQQHIYHQPGL